MHAAWGLIAAPRICSASFVQRAAPVRAICGNEDGDCGGSGSGGAGGESLGASAGRQSKYSM